jgi:uncharacterized membrane protein
MNRTAPRSIQEYLSQLRQELHGADAALIQDALYDAEEYLRAEVAAHPDKSEADVLELIASTYGAPDEVAAAYRETEIKVATAMATPRRRAGGGAGAFLGVFLDPRAYTSLLFMFLALLTGIAYFVFTVVGLALSMGLSVLIIGVPFFLVFVAVGRVLSLVEGRLLEAMTGVRMPRRPVYQPSARGLWTRVGAMLKDRRTWSTLAYFLLMLPLGIIYFVTAVVGVTLSVALIATPFIGMAQRFGWFGGYLTVDPEWLGSWPMLPVELFAGALLFTLLMHLARGAVRMHALFAKALLVARDGPAIDEAASVPLAAL